jgi:hypothetical protein
MTEQIFNFLKDLVAPMGIALVSIPTEIFEYNAVRDYMGSLGFVSYGSEGRVLDTAAAPARK